MNLLFSGKKKLIFLSKVATLFVKVMIDFMV